MRRWLAAILLAVSADAAGQALSEADRENLAFAREVVDAFAQRAYERRLGFLRQQDRLDPSPALRERLATLLARVIGAAELERPGASRLDWQLHTCVRCGEAASAAAGGRLLVGEEFVLGLDLDDDEAGFMLAHEVAHVLAEHTREFAHAARYFVDNGLRREYWDIQRELDGNLPAQYRMAFIAEQQELEADRIALFLGARAGFHPAAMASLLAKLAPPGAGAGPATHPSHLRRADQAAAAMGAAQILWARALAEQQSDRSLR